MFGVGVIIGTGIFVLTGKAAATRAGPAVSVSFVVAGIVWALAALCYQHRRPAGGGVPPGRPARLRDRDLDRRARRPTTVMVILLLGQSRVFFTMSRDRLPPPAFARVSPLTGIPVRGTITTGIVVAVISAFVPLTELAELVDIGTLFAFVLVAIGVLVLPRTRPDLPRASGRRPSRCSRSCRRWRRATSR